MASLVKTSIITELLTVQGIPGTLLDLYTHYFI